MKSPTTLLIVVALGLGSCKRDTTDPKDIMSSSDITMTIEHLGCFDMSTQGITIKTEADRRVLISSYRGKYESLDTIVPFTVEREKALAGLLEEGLSESAGFFCTDRDVYQIKTEKYRCHFENHTCLLLKYLDKLKSRKGLVF